MTNSFNGPLFIVGMPRSGTKLIRNLLLKNDQIGIPLVETGFLPYWSRNWSSFGDLSVYANFDKFYNSTIKLPYFYYMKYEGERHKGELISCSKWYDLCLDYSLSGVFEALIRHDAKVEVGSDKIWGDKSPSYINHIPLLKTHFPNARFIHIIRDVRDYCLSMKKAWNKNIFRAAQRWQNSLAKIERDIVGMEDDYFLLKYEDLIEHPENWLTRICKFLEITYDPKMTSLSESAENLGDTTGVKGIVKTNKQKYRNHFDQDSLKRIEGIAKEMLIFHRYPIDGHIVPMKLSRAEMAYYQLTDALSLVNSKTDEMKDAGIIGAIKFHVRHFMATKLQSALFPFFGYLLINI